MNVRTYEECSVVFEMNQIMALQSPFLQLAAPPIIHVATTRMDFRISSSHLMHKQEQFFQFQKLSLIQRLTPTVVIQRPKLSVTCAFNISRGESGGLEEIKNARLEKVQNMLGDFGEPIKAFPWKKAFTRFFHHLFSLAFWVAKWLSIPVVLISSLSEMTYCGWQNKELLILYGLLSGSVLAGILKETAIELSEDFQEGNFPWHLLIIAAFFALIKLPGPYYPYWLRVFLPHFATGGLLRLLWSANIWYKTQSTPVKVESDPGIN